MLNTAVLFVIFNRPEYTKISIAAIREAKPRKLYIAADGPRDDVVGEAELCKQTRQLVIDAVDWDCEVKTLFREKNLGARQGVSTGITWLFEHEECGIIIEDDVVADITFFGYCEELLDRYRDNFDVWTIGGENRQDISESYPESYTFTKTFSGWGWATWRDRWECYSDDLLSTITNDDIAWYQNRRGFRRYLRSALEGCKSYTLDAWDYIFWFAAIKNRALHVTPKVNMISNIGVIGSHFDRQNRNHHRVAHSHVISIHPQAVKCNHKLQYDLDRQRIPWHYYMFHKLPKPLQLRLKRIKTALLHSKKSNRKQGTTI